MAFRGPLQKNIKKKNPPESYPYSTMKFCYLSLSTMKLWFLSIPIFHPEDEKKQNKAKTEYKQLFKKLLFFFFQRCLFFFWFIYSHKEIKSNLTDSSYKQSVSTDLISSGIVVILSLKQDRISSWIFTISLLTFFWSFLQFLMYKNYKTPCNLSEGM